MARNCKVVFFSTFHFWGGGVAILLANNFIFDKKRDNRCASHICCLVLHKMLAESKTNLTCSLGKTIKKEKIDEFHPEEEQIYQSQGLVSIDRSEAAALLSTTPRLRRRSSTNDLAPLHCMGWISLRHPDSQSRARQ